jgi:hypothetical protein
MPFFRHRSATFWPAPAAFKTAIDLLLRESALPDQALPTTGEGLAPFTRHQLRAAGQIFAPIAIYQLATLP